MSNSDSAKFSNILFVLKFAHLAMSLLIPQCRFWFRNVAFDSAMSPLIPQCCFWFHKVTIDSTMLLLIPQSLIWFYDVTFSSRILLFTIFLKTTEVTIHTLVEFQNNQLWGTWKFWYACQNFLQKKPSSVCCNLLCLHRNFPHEFSFKNSSTQGCRSRIVFV